MNVSKIIPKAAHVAISDMLDNCARLQPGQNVLILCHLDGLHGGPNHIDEQTVAWIEAAVGERDARARTLWLDEPPSPPDTWRLPQEFKEALKGTNVLINNSFDLTYEELIELRSALADLDIVMVRNCATTAALLTSAYAQIPYDVSSQIRHQTGILFQEGLTWRLTHPNGTHLEGKIGLPIAAGGSMHYSQWRHETHYRPFPESVIPPITSIGTEGIFVFDQTLTWWSRYVGIPPYFSQPIRLTVEKGHITRFEGGSEAEALQRFLDAAAERFGEAAYEVAFLHSGVHPHSDVEPHLCPNPAFRRLLEHQHSSNIHLHLGNVDNRPDWPYMLHVTAEIRGATWQVGDALVHDRGHLTALDHPEVRAVADRYPDRPGPLSEPWR